MVSRSNIQKSEGKAEEAPNKVKVILFDLGGVFINFSHEQYAAELSKRGNVSPEKALDSFKRLVKLSDMSKIKIREFEHRLAEEVGIKGRINYYKDFSRFVSPIPEVKEIAEGLARAYTLGILSTIGQVPYIATINRGFLDPKLFKAKFLSWCLGVAKPDPVIFQHTVSTLGERFEVQPNQILFIDDLNVNIAGAVDVGMKGIVFQNPQQLRAELKRLLRAS
jgi:putative hydrolase of the HAD superfamily